MSADWAFALKTGGVGFGSVFVILSTLYLALWVMGRVSAKLSQNKTEAQVGEKRSSALKQV